MFEKTYDFKIVALTLNKGKAMWLKNPVSQIERWGFVFLNRCELDIRLFGNMKKDEFKLWCALVILALAFILACANTPYIVGKWKEIGKTATLEFWKDGTFKAVDNQGMAVKGKYTLIEPGNVRFEIFRQDSPPEIVNGTFSLKGDVLTFTSADGKEIERYKHEK